jgi:hypothetical protein
MGNLTDALESLGWAARSQEYRSTAYALMAGIELQLGNKELAEHYGKLSLDFNRTNFNALEVLSILYRKSGETARADKCIETISNLDPLNHFADFERNIIHPSADNYSRFTSDITNEMPYQTYLELCMIYYGYGLKDDALLVLDKAPSQPEIMLWKAFLKGDPAMLNEVASASPAYVFPYRTESVSALKWAVSKNPNWKFKYYLAMNCLATQRDAEAMQLFQACGQEPDYAPFYLARAVLLRPRNDKQELQDLQSSKRLAPDDWRTDYRLISYYDALQNYQMTLSLSTEAYKKHKDNSDIGVQYAIALINNGQYAKSLKTLEGMNILPSEGSRQGKVIFEQACLFLSIDLIKNKKYAEAMKMIEKSKEWPENLGVGKPYDVETRIQDYLDIFCLEKLKRPNETEVLRKSIIDYTNQDASPSFNNILALKLLKEKGDTEAANSLVQLIEKSGGPENPVNKWVIASYKNDQAQVTVLEKEFAKNNYFLIAKKISELK